MRTELEDIANPGDRIGWTWLERPLLQPLGGVTENDMIDFGRGEPGDLYWRVQQDQFFKLNLQRIEIPLSFFGEAVDASRRTRCSSGLRCSMRTHGTRSRPNCFAAS